MAVKTNKAPSTAMDNHADSARDLVRKAKRHVEKIGSPDLSKMVCIHEQENRLWRFKNN